MASFGTIFQPFSDLFFRSDKKQLPSLLKLNDSVYEFYSPPDGMSVSLEIIFFHGVERGDYSKAYVKTWTSFSESTANCWPQTLLAEEFRRARILSVSYDSSIEKGPEQGNLDLYLTAENLVQDLDAAKVAASPGLPVILVGKDFGGLVIKAICMKAKDQNRSTFLSNLPGNLKGIFYYGTPHLGVENLPTAFNGALAERLKFGNEEIARLGSEFSKYRKESEWTTRAILSLHTSEKVIQKAWEVSWRFIVQRLMASQQVPELVISEASQRYDVDECYTTNKGIDTVCKSQARTSSSFKLLTGLISCIECGKLNLESSPDQGLTLEGIGFKTSLGFGQDGNYVPIKTTLAAVKNALQEAHVVVLHGGPGSGKSSLAKYLALQFEAATQQQGINVASTSSAEQSDWLPNGVVYITCGKGAEIASVQSELLRKFNIEVTLLQEKSLVLEGAAKLQEMLHEDLVKHLSKLQSRVLVILDDVWDSPDLLENLLVPADHVRYLLTTQISTLWNAYDSMRVPMQDVTLEDARHILGNYANFKGGVITKHLENLGDEIIAAAGSHPLALATLGNVLNMERTDRHWQEVKGNLMQHLETKDYRPSSFGRKYPLSVNASMMVGLDLLDEDAKKLLYIITLFDGPFIPETLLQLFVTCTLSRDEKINMSKSKMSLVAKGLVRIEIETFGEEVTNSTSSSARDDMRVIWIHSLLQHFILTTKTGEIGQITNFLDFRISTYFLDKFLHLGERSNFDLAIALCALYGVTDIKRRAMQKMGSHFIRRHSRQMASALKPFVSLMLSKGDTESPISQAATKVFLEYVYKGELDDDKICYLLKLTTYPSAPLATLQALADIFEIEYFSVENVRLIDKDHLCFVSVIVSLLGSRNNAHGRIEEEIASETPEIQICACRALLYICAKARREKSTAVLQPHVLPVLVHLIQAALQAESAELSNQLAAYAVKILRVLSNDNSKDAKLKICNTEGLLVGLVGSLSAHYNRPLPEYAAAALRNLASADDVDIKLKICNEDGGLSGLVRSLSEHDNPHLQQWAAGTLQNLAMDVASARRICDERGSLAALVQSLLAPTNPALQRGAAFALANLAHHGVDFGLEICDQMGTLSGLVELLFQEENADVQGAAALALRNLASKDETIQLKVANEEGAFEGLLRAISQHDKPFLQEAAMWALNNLAMAAGQSIKLKIAEEEWTDAVAGLMKLSKHKISKLREPATRLVVTLGLERRKRRWMKVHFLKCI